MLINLGTLQLMIKIKLLFKIFNKMVLPKPGDGPSKKKMKDGFFKMKIIGFTNEVTKISVIVAGDSDPGYSATAKMLTEAAISII